MHPLKPTGRKPLLENKKEKRFYIRLTPEEHSRYLELKERSGVKRHADFIRKRIFAESFRVNTVDTTGQQYWAKVAEIFYQYRGIATNYNEAVKVLHSKFSEKKAYAMIKRMEDLMRQVVHLNQEIIKENKEFNGYLRSKNDPT